MTSPLDCAAEQSLRSCAALKRYLEAAYHCTSCSYSDSEVRIPSRTIIPQAQRAMTLAQWLGSGSL